MNTPLSSTRLTAQRLAGSNLQTPAAAVAWMGAMQAQDYNMAKCAVALRCNGTDKAVEAAYNKGDILRTHVLRPTWHFVTPAAIRWMLELTSPRILLQTRSRDQELGLTAKTVEKSHRVLTHALKGGNYLTREELVRHWEEAGIRTDNYRHYHLLMRAELDAVICSGALRGKKHTYALLEERAPSAKKFGKEKSLEMLAQCYFTSRAPATLHDFVWWSGLTVGEARQGMEMIRDTFVAKIINGKEYLCDPSADIKKGAATGIYLLPAFDEYIIGYKDRTATVTATHHRKAISSNGVFRPVILHHGKAIGLWKKITKQTKTGILPSFFETPNTSVVQAVEQAVQKFLHIFSW